MANALIVHGNLADNSNLTLGAWVGSLPISNLKNRVQGVVARTLNANLASTKFLIELPTGKLTRGIGLINHNFSLSAKIRIRASDTSATMVSGVQFDTGWVDAWSAVFATSNLEWENFNFWNGQYTNDDREGYTWNFIRVVDFSILARFWLVEIDDTTNAAGYVEIGRLFIGDAWQFQINMDYGASLGWEDNTLVDESLSGTEFFDKRPLYRVSRFSLGGMYEEEAYGKAFDIIRRTGISGEILFVYDPADTLHALRRQFRARLRTLSPIENPTVDVFSTVFEVKELL